jgi:hypothetical protein
MIVAIIGWTGWLALLGLWLSWRNERRLIRAERRLERQVRVDRRGVLAAPSGDSILIAVRLRVENSSTRSLGMRGALLKISGQTLGRPTSLTVDALSGKDVERVCSQYLPEADPQLGDFPLRLSEAESLDGYVVFEVKKSMWKMIEIEHIEVEMSDLEDRVVSTGAIVGLIVGPESRGQLNGK